jgi:hypothetical protein
MSEFTLEDGRKAEKVENNVDSMTKVIEVYVEPKQQKKLSQRVTERLCVCERVVEILDEVTGEVVSTVVEKVCEGATETKSQSKSPVLAAVESRIGEKKNVMNYVFVAVILAQLALLAYVTFGM